MPQARRPTTKPRAERGNGKSEARTALPARSGKGRVPEGGLPRVEVRRSAIHGRGLFATESIPRGSYIGRYEGPRTRREGAYVLWIEEEDGETYGVAGKNHLRFVNHSKRPNATFDGEDLYATRAIRAGDEITFDYGTDWT